MPLSQVSFGVGPLHICYAVAIALKIQKISRYLVPAMGAGYNYLMRIIARSTLREFWERHTDTEDALKAWYQDANQTQWKTPEEIKSVYASASIVANNRVVFNIKGNQYRLIVAINYRFGIVYIRFIGSHREYDKIDAATV